MEMCFHSYVYLLLTPYFRGYDNSEDEEKK